MAKTQPYFHVLNEMKKQGITQREMANALNMNVATFNHKINRTNGNDFSFSQAKEIARQLKIMPSVLFFPKSFESETNGEKEG